MKEEELSNGMHWLTESLRPCPHSWVMESLNMTRIAKNVVNLLEKTMKFWWVKLTCGAERLGEVPIKRGIFQGDALPPLLFVPSPYLWHTYWEQLNEFRTGEKLNHLLLMDDFKLYSKKDRALDSLIQTVRIFSEDIGMEFGIDKCAMLVMQKRKIEKSYGIPLPNDKVIKSLEKGESYKHLGVLEADEVMVNEMKDKVEKECYRRVRKVSEKS